MSTVKTSLFLFLAQPNALMANRGAAHCSKASVPGQKKPALVEHGQAVTQQHTARYTKQQKQAVLICGTMTATEKQIVMTLIAVAAMIAKFMPPQMIGAFQ